MKYHLTGRPFRPSVLMVFCFFAGILSGTVWVNLMAEEIQGQLGTFGQAGLMGNPGLSAPRAEMIFGVFFKRGAGAGFLWLLGMTAFAVPGLCAAAALCGLSMALIISLMTVQSGLFGLPVYLLSIFPQALFYVPVACVLLVWGLKGKKSAHPAGFAVLLFAVFAGAVLETCVNPFCMRFLSFLK